jgi:hypothetical protein
VAQPLVTPCGTERRAAAKRAFLTGGCSNHRLPERAGAMPRRVAAPQRMGDVGFGAPNAFLPAWIT